VTSIVTEVSDETGLVVSEVEEGEPLRGAVDSNPILTAKRSAGLR
jgi:hypothetical protein